MLVKPRARLLFRIALVSFLLLVGAFALFEWEILQGEPEAKARTVAVNVFVFGQLFYLFNCRSLRYSMFRLGLFSNPWIFLGVSTMAALQLLFTYTPAMNRMFGSAPVGAIEWSIIIATGVTIYVVVGIEKWLRARRAMPAEKFSM